MGEKSLYDYKLGEKVDKDLFNGIMKKPNKLVKIGYTFQSEEGTQMEVALKTNDFIEDEEEDKKESGLVNNLDVMPDEG